MQKIVTLSYTRFWLTSACMALVALVGLCAPAYAVTYMSCPGEVLAVWDDGVGNGPCGGYGDDTGGHSFDYTLRYESIGSGHYVADPEAIGIQVIARCLDEPRFGIKAYNVAVCTIFYAKDQVPQISIPPVDSPANQCGSIIHADHLSVGEPVPLVGTPFALVYFSDRVPGRVADYLVTYAKAGVWNLIVYVGNQPAIKSQSDPVIPSGAQTRTEVRMQNAVVATAEVPMSATLTYGTFHWNGTDANGHLVPGSVPVTITSTDIICDPVGSTNCQEYVGPEHTVLLGTWQARVVGLGGWWISAHHFYDAVCGRKCIWALAAHAKPTRCPSSWARRGRSAPSIRP